MQANLRGGLSDAGRSKAAELANDADILYGHTHARNVFRWEGTAKAAQDGIPTFNVDNSSYFAGDQQAFFYLEVRDDGLVVAEYQTADAWESGSWTPQTWTAPVAKAQK